MWVNVFKLFLATNVMVLTFLSDYVISFNYGHKETMDVGLTCRCHLNHIMLDSIFYDSIGW